MLELSATSIMVMFGSIASFSIYLNLLKKYPENKFSLFFWTHLFSYAAFTIFVLVYEVLMEHEHMSAVKDLVTDTTITNMPFYFLEAIITIAAVFVMKRLMSLANTPTVLAFSQISVLFSAISFYLLGDTVTTKSTIGLLIIATGALIAGLKKFSPNLFEDYDFELFKAGIIYALLQSSRAVITYLCTAKMNPTTHSILSTLTKHLHIIPFAPITPLHFNIGVQFLTIITLFVYITYRLEQPESIINGLKNTPGVLLSICTSFVAFGFFYYKAFGLVGNKELVVGMQKLSIPLTVLIAYFAYQTKPTKQAILGIIVILAGSAFTVLV